MPSAPGSNQHDREAAGLAQIVLSGLACLLEKEFNELVDLAAELDATYESDTLD